MHIWDIGTVSHCTWMGLQCDTFLGAVKQHIFYGPIQEEYQCLHKKQQTVCTSMPFAKEH